MLLLAKKYKAFHSVDSLKKVVDSFKEAVRGLVPKSIIKVVDFLYSHSKRIEGVSFAKYEYMVDKIGLSESTLKRAVKRLTELGFIHVINVYSNGQQRSNIYQIQPDIDLDKVYKLLLERTQLTIIAPTSEPLDEVQESTQNDTPPISEESLLDKALKRLSAIGGKKQVIQDKQNEWIGYNWLQNDDLKISTRHKKSSELSYLLSR